MAVTQVTATSGFMIDGVMMLNSTIDVNGAANSVILDADGDTHISSPTDDQIDISIAGADDFTITANSLNTLTGSCLAGPSSTFVPFIPIAAEQALSGAGAINVTTYHTKWTTTGVNAGTLADGVVKGQLKKITMVVDAGDGTLTPANLSGGTTITFADPGDYVVLCFDGTDWVMIESGNAADGVSTPAFA
jgi:hypothetical protein